MITDKDIKEYFEHNPKSKGVGVFMIDLAECNRYEDFGDECYEYGVNCIEPDQVVMNNNREEE
tara:strand:+ start:1368 stop:1556 length:189 start_codon:yes stop_codon:yes gene_type:complete